MKPAAASIILASILATGCAGQVVREGNKQTFASSKPPEALLACVEANAEKMNGVMLMLYYKRSTAEDGSPRLIIERPLNNFAVVDAKPAGSGTLATVHLGFAAFAPETYGKGLTKGCA